MRPIKLGLRIWIAFTAAVSFFTGWAMLAHSGKPAPLPIVAGGASQSGGGLVLPTLAPVPSLNDLSSSSSQSQNLQPLPVQPAPLRSRPSLVSRGS